eukprot:9803503-Lingulodinium_polyedra.AAC.1
MTIDCVVAGVRALLPEDLRDAWARLNGGAMRPGEGSRQAGERDPGRTAEQLQEEERLAAW